MTGYTILRTLGMAGTDGSPKIRLASKEHLREPWTTVLITTILHRSDPRHANPLTDEAFGREITITVLNGSDLSEFRPAKNLTSLNHTRITEPTKYLQKLNRPPTQ